MRIGTNFILGAAALMLLGSSASAQNRNFDEGSLIVPTDNAYQSEGIYQAYGLLYQLLDQDVTVYWVIDNEKTWHHADCDTAGDECSWDCAEEGSGIKCDYPLRAQIFSQAPMLCGRTWVTLPARRFLTTATGVAPLSLTLPIETLLSPSSMLGMINRNGPPTRGPIVQSFP